MLIFDNECIFHLQRRTHTEHLRASCRPPTTLRGQVLYNLQDDKSTVIFSSKVIAFFWQSHCTYMSNMRRSSASLPVARLCGYKRCRTSILHILRWISGGKKIPIEAAFARTPKHQCTAGITTRNTIKPVRSALTPHMEEKGSRMHGEDKTRTFEQEVFSFSLFFFISGENSCTLNYTRNPLRTLWWQTWSEGLGSDPPLICRTRSFWISCCLMQLTFPPPCLCLERAPVSAPGSCPLASDLARVLAASREMTSTSEVRYVEGLWRYHRGGGEGGWGVENMGVVVFAPCRRRGGGRHPKCRVDYITRHAAQPRCSQL